MLVGPYPLSSTAFTMSVRAMVPFLVLHQFPNQLVFFLCRIISSTTGLNREPEDFILKDSFLTNSCTTKLKRIIRGNTFIVDWDIMRVNGYVDRRGSGS